MKIEKLTTEQEALMQAKKKEWLEYFFSCKNSLDRAKATPQIEWLYKFCGKDKPVIIYVDSPLACQYAVQYLKVLFKNIPKVGDQVRDQVWAQVWDQVRAQVRDQVRDQVWDQVRDQVGDQVWAQVGDQVWDQVRAQHEPFATYGSVWDYGWISFYDFFETIGVVNHKGYKEFKKLLQSGIYDMIQLHGFCIVSDLPKSIKRNGNNRMHCEDGPAIEYRDGYALHYWNGVCVPKEWIETPASITKEVIMREDNAEKRRVMREILGPEEYFNRIGGVVVIDEDTDDKGNIMRLYRSKEKDEIINKYIQFLAVICPSTQRQYILYPPDQKSKNVWSAKASTFRNEKIMIRHGDCGILNMAKAYEKPIFES